MLVGQCDSPQVLSEVKLAIGSVLDQVVPGDEGVSVTVLKHLGLPDEAVTVVPWDELDRVVVPDHLTSSVAPPPRRSRSPLSSCAWRSWPGRCGRVAPGTASRPTRA